jgi:hypothetical protein
MRQREQIENLKDKKAILGGNVDSTKRTLGGYELETKGALVAVRNVRDCQECRAKVTEGTERGWMKIENCEHRN